MAGHFDHAQGTDTSIYLISTNADLYNPMVHKSPNVCLGLKSKPFAWTNSGFYFRLCFLCYHEGRLFPFVGYSKKLSIQNHDMHADSLTVDASQQAW